MATWLSLSNLKGISTSPPLMIPVETDGSITRIAWDADVPNHTQVIIQTKISFDQGRNWTEWRTCTNRGSIPDLDPTTKLNQIQLMYRLLMQSAGYSATPKLKQLSLYVEPVIIVNNKGDLPLKPELWITKQGHGSITIHNLSLKQSDFTMRDLTDQETVYINNDTQLIESSLPVTYRYTNFNDQYLDLPAGINMLRVNGNARLQFRYEYKFL